MNRERNIVAWIFFLSLLLLSLFLTFANHQREYNFSWKGTIWSDKAGYYIYLPATFFYQFDGDQAIPGLEQKTGYGFTIDKTSKKISTKYTYGVALLLTPFFLTVHGLSLLFGIPELGGFSPLYQEMVNVAAVIYLILGLVFLKMTLARRFKPLVQYIVLFLLYFGTNLLYYTIDESLMSHVYSFFLFSLCLFALESFLRTRKYRMFLLLALAASLTLIVRPVNALVLILLVFWNVTTRKEFLDRIRLWLHPGYLLPFALMVLVFALPQLLYWHYLTGHCLHYSYGDESFSNWLHPRVAGVWFAPLNGLFLYTPLVLVMVAGMIGMIVKREINGILLFCVFLLVTVLCATWQTWYFGCSFGQRPFVEYYVLFSIPLGFIIRKGVETRRWGLKITGVMVFTAFLYYNIRMTYAWEKCFPGPSWDWDAYGRIVTGAGLIPGPYVSSLFYQDFENQDFVHRDQLSMEFSRSGSWSGTFSASNPVCGQLEYHLYDVGWDIKDTLQVRFWAYKPRFLSTQTDLECFLIHQTDTVYRESQPIDALITGIHRWCEVKTGILLPAFDHRDARVVIRFRNRSGKPLFLDDIYLDTLQ